MHEEHIETEEEIAEVLPLSTHTNILKNNGYHMLSLTKNHATLKLINDTTEKVSDTGNIYDGAVLSATIFAAIAAVNEKNVFVIGTQLDLLNPIMTEDDIIIHADANLSSAGKKIVHVVGMIDDIVFMEGTVILLKLDEKSLIK